MVLKVKLKSSINKLFHLLIRAVALLGKCRVFIALLPYQHKGRDVILRELEDLDFELIEVLKKEKIQGDKNG